MCVLQGLTDVDSPQQEHESFLQDPQAMLEANTLKAASMLRQLNLRAPPDLRALVKFCLKVR